MSTTKTKIGAKEHAQKTSVTVQAALPLLDPDVQRSLENLATQVEAILDILPVGTGVDNTVPRFVGTSGLIEPTALVISDTSFLSGAAGVGIGGASADATNRLSANTPAVLFNRETDNIQVKLNKEAAGDTASFLFQTAFSGRAEIGLVGDDNFVFKTSPDGSAFNSGLTVLGADAGVRVHVNIAPNANDGAPLGLSGTAFSDLFLASGAVINFNAGDVTVTHAANALAFAGASSGYSFDASLLLVSGTALNWNSGDVTVTHSADTLAFAGAATAYTFAGGPVHPAANDGAALGISGTAWSDLFLASGAVINFNAGDVTITHAANALAFTGASSGYSFDALVQPAANDGAALGTAAAAWSDLFLADGAVIDFNNGDLTLTKSASTTLTLNSIGQTVLALTSVPTAGLGNCGIELGRVDGTGSTPFIDFHSGATAVDHDVRLIASGGTGANGGGALGVEAASFRPQTNNVTQLGTATVSWSDLFLADGAVINFNNGDVTLTHSSTALHASGLLGGDILRSNHSDGAEGGEIYLAIPASGHTLSGSDVVVDVAANRFRIFENGGSFRGAHIDFTNCEAGAESELYHEGGTDVSVADGGTGRSSHTAYAVICGGTTATAAQQSIASVGTSGQVLTSNGAGALPTFQTSPAGLVAAVTSGAISAAATLDIALGSADMYEIDLINLKPASDVVILLARFSQSGSFIASAGSYSWGHSVGNTQRQSASDADMEIGLNLGNGTNEISNLTVRVFRPSASGFTKSMTFFGYETDNSNGRYGLVGGGQLIVNTDPIDGIRFLMSGGGNIASGYYAVRSYSFT